MKARLLLGLGIVALIVGGVAWQLNAQNASGMARAIVVADAQGADVTGAIVALGDYVGGHMHASVSFDLTAAYQRALDQAKANAVPTPSGKVYTDAGAACNSQRDSLLQATCIRNYVAAHSAAPSTQPLVMPDKAKFHYAFVAPVWSPDPAGLGLALGSLAFIVGLAWYLSDKRR